MPKRRRRSFTPPFMAQVVLEALAGLKNPSEIAGRHMSLRHDVVEQELARDDRDRRRPSGWPTAVTRVQRALRKKAHLHPSIR